MTSAAAAIPPRMGHAEWALLLMLSLLWGGSFFLVEVALAGLPPLTIVWLRVTLAAMVLAATLAASRMAFPPRAAWGALAVMGLANCALPFTLFAVAQGQIASGLAAILNAMTPLFGVVVAALAGAERMTPARLAGVVLGLSGVAAMTGGGAGAPGAMAMCLGAALSYALAGVWGRRFAAMGLTPPATAFGMLVAASVLILPGVLLLEQPWELPAPPAQVAGAVVVLAVASTALAYLIYFRLLAAAGAVNLLLVTFLIPVGAVALGVLLLDEALSLAQLVGMALIACGLRAVTRRRR